MVPSSSILFLPYTPSFSCFHLLPLTQRKTIFTYLKIQLLTFRLNSHEAEPKLYEVEPKLYEVESKLYEVESKLYEVESKLYEVDTNINKTKTKTNNNKAKCSVVVDDVVVDSVIEAISNGSETRGLTFRLNSSGNSGTRWTIRG